VILLSFPEAIFSVFVRPDEPLHDLIIHLGGHAMRVMMFFFPLVGVNVIAGGYFQAHGRPLLSLMLTLFRQMIFLLPAMVLFPYLFQRFTEINGLSGVWTSFAAADFLAFIVTLVCLAREYRMKRRAIARQRQTGGQP